MRTKAWRWSLVVAGIWLAAGCTGQADGSSRASAQPATSTPTPSRASIAASVASPMVTPTTSPTRPTPTATQGSTIDPLSTVTCAGTESECDALFSQLASASSRTSSIESRLSALSGANPGPVGPLDGRWRVVSSTIKGKTVEQSADLDISAGIIDGPCAPGIITTGSSTLDVVWGPDDPGCDYQHAQTQRTVATVLLNNVSYRRAGQTLTLRNSYGYQLIAQSIRKFLKDSHSPVIAR